MRRSLTEIVRQESPISLAREALWRSRRSWRKRRFLSQIQEPHCPVTFRNVPYYASAVPKLSETSQALITGYADEICEGSFPFLGYGTWELGYEPKWNVDFVSGLEWPSVPIRDHDGIRFDGADVKVPWELSRLQFLPILGKAYVLTGNERYRQNAKRLLSSWMKNNPVGIGVNWSVAMEAALRAMSICFMLNLVSPLRQEEQRWLQTVTRCLWHHMLYIEAHIEFSHLISSNHYLSNVIGLYCLSEFLDGHGMTARRRLYRQRVESEILRQTYEDGGDYEASIGYHVLVTQMLTSGLLLMRASKIVPEAPFLERLRLMYMMIEYLASPTGLLPHVGDCDDGRVELLLDDLAQMRELPVRDRNSLRVSNLMGIGRCLLRGSHGSAEDAMWYGPEKMSEPDSSDRVETAPLGQEVVIFPQSGIGIVRTEHAEMLLFAVPNGINGKGSHTHNDKLSFVLRLDGEEVLCDSGTGTYTRDPEMRNRFRATSAHNTVVVDGQEQNTIDSNRASLFYMGTEVEVSPIEQTKESEDLILRASHTGYKRFGVTHTRTIRLCAENNMAIVEDQLEGDGTHHFEINLQLTPKWRVSSVENLESKIRARVSGARELQILFQSSTNVNAEQEESLISMTYGACTPTNRLRIWGQSVFPATLTTILSWTDQSGDTTDAKKAGVCS
jgi:Heparinase II/III-like protein/Heparinase II/III N-terminus